MDSKSDMLDLARALLCRCQYFKISLYIVMHACSCPGLVRIYMQYWYLSEISAVTWTATISKFTVSMDHAAALLYHPFSLGWFSCSG